MIRCVCLPAFLRKICCCLFFVWLLGGGGGVGVLGVGVTLLEVFGVVGY